MPATSRPARGKSASARSPSPRGRKSAAPTPTRKSSRLLSPALPDTREAGRGARRESPTTTAASAPVSSGWHATVGAAPIPRGNTALRRFLAQLVQLLLIAVTPPTAQLMCVRALAASRLVAVSACPGLTHNYRVRPYAPRPTR